VPPRCKMVPVVTLLIAVCLFASGCGRDWPDLASIPEAEPIAPQAPVQLPAPMRPVAPLDAASVEDALSVIPARLDRFELRIAGQQERYKRRLAEAKSGGSPMAVRSAQVELSRLSAIETALTFLLEDLERLRVSSLSPELRTELATLRERAETTKAQVSAFLVRERQRLARRPGSQ